MADPNDCLAAVDAANAGRLDDEAVASVVAEMQRAKRSAEGLDGLDRAMFDAAEQLRERAELAARIEKRNRMINIIRHANLKELARSAKEATDDPSMGLEAAMVGVNAPFVGSRASVDAKSNGILRQYLGGMVADLRQEGLLPKFNSKALSPLIARELWDLSLPTPTGKVTTSKDAKAIARIVHKYRRAAIERENRAGAFIRYRSGYVTRQSHDAQKMRRAGFEAWRDGIAKRIDWETMDVPAEERPKFLRSAYEALTTGVRLAAAGEDESGLSFAFKGPGNLAKRESASRVILFKSADDWSAYNDRFGRSDLNEALLADFRRSAQATALLDTFGPNPRAMFDRIRDDLREENRGTPALVDRLNRRTLEWQFAEIDGSVNIAQNHLGASLGRGFRAVQSMAKLGGAVISAVADLAAVMSERRYQGRGLGDALMDSFNAPFRGLTSKGDERRLAEMIGAGIDGMLGDFVSRFAAQDDVPGRMSKIMAGFFKLNLLGPWTDAVKRGVGLMMANDLAAKAGAAWDDLDATTRRLLSGYGMDATGWELARGAVVEVDGRRYMVPDAVPEGADRASRRERDRVSAALSAYLADRADTASPTPGARERALLRMGLQPGSVEGEAVRFLMQFKSFPITVTSKVLGRDLYGHGAKSLRAAILRGEGDLLGLTSFIAAGTALGLFALQAKEIAKGREPREVNQSTLVAAMLQGGGLGIYGDFLLGETNRYGRSMLDTLAGPTLGTLSDVDQIRAKVMAGEDVWAEVLRTAQSNTPFANLFYTKAAVDYLVLYQLQEVANPGYLRRMERRMKRENNQEFFFAPSRAVPRGGGSRPFEGVR